MVEILGPELRPSRLNSGTLDLIYLPTPDAFGSGGGERVRTDGLLRARQALSQLSYTPQRLLRIWDCGFRNCCCSQIRNLKSKI